MLESLLLSLGGSIVSKLITQKFGPQFGDIAQSVLNQLGQAFGVAPDANALETAINAAPAGEAQKKIAGIEASAADMVLAQVELIKQENITLQLTNDQITAEAKQSWFGWAWRPGWMWLLGIFWFWELIGLHGLNAIFKIALPPTDLAILLQLTGLYLALYLGGHTVKDFVAKKWGGA